MSEQNENAWGWRPTRIRFTEGRVGGGHDRVAVPPAERRPGVSGVQRGHPRPVTHSRMCPRKLGSGGRRACLTVAPG